MAEIKLVAYVCRESMITVSLKYILLIKTAKNIIPIAASQNGS
jgi:hypothetical protein